MYLTTRSIRILALVVIALLPCQVSATRGKELRCENAQRELKQVNAKLKQADPRYAGGLRREQALWKRQVERHCGGESRRG